MKSETETVIVINEADRRDGYFTIGSSNISHIRKIERRLGSDIIERRDSRGPDGKLTFSQFRAPISRLSGTLAIKPKLPPAKPGRSGGFGARI